MLIGSDDHRIGEDLRDIRDRSYSRVNDSLGMDGGRCLLDVVDGLPLGGLKRVKGVAWILT